MIFLIMLFLLFGFGTASASADFASALNASIKAYPPTAKLGGMGGAWSAPPSPHGNNPAAFTGLMKYNLKGAVYTDYSFVNFNNGPDVDVLVADALTILGRGVLRVDYCHFSSNKERTGMMTPLGQLFGELKGESLQIGYGFPINSKFSIGATYIPIYSSDVAFEAEFLGKMITASEGKSRSRGAFRLGGLYNPKDWLYLGLTYEHGKDKIETTTLTQLGYEKSVEYPTTDLVRPGLTIKPWQGGTFSIDWLWGRIDNERGEDYDIDKWFFGAEQYLNQHFCVRAGSFDGSPTVGVGIVWKSLFIDYSYVKKPLKDMQQYFGSSSANMVAVTLVW